MEDSQEKPVEQQNSSNGFEQQGNGQPEGATETARVAELEAQLAKIQQENQDLRNKYLRLQADMDNFRKRQERLLVDRVQQQKKAMFHKLLDVMDNVERALTYQETMDRQQLQQTLRMFHWQMVEVLRSEGVTPVPTVGEAFNPYMHEAVEAVENSDQPEGTILEEERKGYAFGEETLRPARVKVSMGNK